jgi:uncharacterized protein (TIGR00251 family)
VNDAWRLMPKGVLLRVRVQPRSNRDQVAGLWEGRLRVRIAAPPVDGKANCQLARVIAKIFRVPKSRVVILTGETGREKTLLVTGATEIPEALQQLKNPSHHPQRPAGAGLR